MLKAATDKADAEKSIAAIREYGIESLKNPVGISDVLLALSDLTKGQIKLIAEDFDGFLDMLVDFMSGKDLNEVAGQDGVTPIAHAKTRNRMAKDPEYYIVVDPNRATIPDYDSKYVMPNMRFTEGVTIRDFQDAWKTTVPKKAAQFLLDVIKRYPTYYVALLRDRWTYAPVSYGGSAQRRPGMIDCWRPGDKISPGSWKFDAKHLKYLDRSIDFTLPTLQKVVEDEDGWTQKMVLKDIRGKVIDSYEWECVGGEWEEN